MPVAFSGPNYVYLQVTKECCGCAWECYVKPDGIAMSLREAKKIVDLLKESKVFAIIIDGGNVLEWDGIHELIKYIRSKSMVVGLALNGQIDKQEINALGRVKPNMMQIPLEGPEKTHDSIRGEQSYKRTLEALVEARKRNLEMHVGTTVAGFNLPYLSETSDAIHHLVSLHRLIRYVPPSGKGFLTPQENLKVLEIMHDLRFNKGREITVNNCYTFMMVSKIREKIRKPEDFLGCLAGKTSLYITAEGYITPCPMLSSKDVAMKVKAPAIWETNLLETWKNWDFLQRIREPCIECQECKYAETCGGCRALSFFVNGDFLKDPGCPFGVIQTAT